MPRSIARLVIALAPGLLAAGCAIPSAVTEPQLAEARATVHAAREACASGCRQAELARAAGKLAAAERWAAARDLVPARWLAEQAQVDAELVLALSPRRHAALEEARRQHAALRADPRVARLAPDEWRRAEEALQAAIDAWSTRDDPALLDHLAYVARQRIAIARAVAERTAREAAN